ncbi:MAG: cytochrome-c peroxidase, partial [Pseudomonadota bacterium]
VTLEDQSLEPIENPVEMAHTLEAVRETLRDDPEHAERFESIYPDGVTINNMSDALAHFQRINFLRLDTPFQRYLNGERDALDEQERRGMRRFRKIGCASCHNGINLGGNSYQKLGSATAYYGANREAGPHDMGVMDRSDRERDRHVFRVPGLHGVATTPPYFHDGSVSTLEEAIDRMGQFQLGRELSQQDINDIEAFLRSLGGHFNSSGAATDDRLRAEEEATRDLSGMTHAEAYRSAMASLEAAGERLLTELRRIDEGDVAHFDFLQREHLEMIRYARALGHPPAALEESVREALKAAARETLDRVNRLEWVIADFLRAEAMTRVFAAHLEVPATAALPEGVADPESALNEHMARAEEAMAAMMEARPAESAAAVRRVYADVD